MHRILINAAGVKTWDLKSPGAYYVDDVNTGEALVLNLATQARHVPLEKPDWAPHCSMLPPERVLIIRPGGFGDIIMLTAALQALHEQNPGVAIHVATAHRYAPMLRNLGFPVTIEPYPVPSATWDSFHGAGQPIVSLEGLVENRHDIHPCQAYAEALGIGALTKPTAILNLTQQELEQAAARYPRKEDEKRLGLQVRASATCRTWPGPKLVEFARMALANGWRVFLFGSPGDFLDPPASAQNGQAPKRLVNLTSAKPPLTFRESCAVLTTCDVIVAPDSGLIHAAGALGLPALSLYGPFDHKMRTSIYPSVRNIQGHARCSPCNYQVRGGHDWPENCPGQHTNECQAMNDIDAKRVLKGINALLDLTEEAQARPSQTIANDRSTIAQP